MTAILENITVFLPFFLVPWVLLILCVLWRPQHLFNSFLLLIALFCTIPFIAGLFGDYMSTALVIMVSLLALCTLAAPVILILNGVKMRLIEGHALANALSLIVGILIALGEIAYIAAMVGFANNPDPSFWVRLLLFLGSIALYVCILLLAFMLYSVFIVHLPRRKDFGYIIIHGCGLLNGERVGKLLAGRLDTAIALWERCDRKPLLIPSGGKGSDESLSEAAAMANYLREKGVPEECILLEDKSTTTQENLECSKALIDAREAALSAATAVAADAAADGAAVAAGAADTVATGAAAGKEPRVALVSSNFHVYRCLRYARRLKFKCAGVGAPVAKYYWPSAVIREFAAVMAERRMLVLALIGLVVFVGPSFVTLWG